MKTHGHRVASAKTATAGIRKAALGIVMSFALSACASFAPQHDQLASCEISTHCDHSIVEQSDRYLLGYVEYDDRGDYSDPRQIETVARDIRSQSGHGLILVAFTHGWKSTARADDWTVAAFKSMLESIAAREDQLAARESRLPRRVAGVYLGWPGQGTTMPLLAPLTYFNRRLAAERVAMGALGDTLQKLKALRDASGSGSSNGQLILIGHSVGADMLYERLIKRPLQHDNIQVSPMADLVLLLSPAIAAADIEAMNSFMTVDQAAFPKIMAITSETDETLRLAFPFGQWLENPHRARQPDSGNYLQAMGTQDSLITHRLEYDKSHCAVSSCNGSLVLTETDHGKSESGLYQITATRDVMDGHKDITNPRLMEFISDVAEMQIDNRLTHAALAHSFVAAAAKP